MTLSQLYTVNETSKIFPSEHNGLWDSKTTSEAQKLEIVSQFGAFRTKKTARVLGNISKEGLVTIEFNQSSTTGIRFLWSAEPTP